MRLNENKEQVTDEEVEQVYNDWIKEGSSGKNYKEFLENNGLKNDVRLKHLEPLLKGVKLKKEELRDLLEQKESKVLLSAIRKELVIPLFSEFKEKVEEIFKETAGIKEGEIDETLPHPGTKGEPAYAVSICTVDGQLLQMGDHDLSFSVQSISKVVNYAIAREEVGKEKLHAHVGVEPGGEDFKTGRVLNDRDKPHNPLINSGAIMTSCFIQPDKEMEERLQHVMKIWEQMMGDKKVEYKEESFKAEMENADTNFALAHLMRERDAFPGEVDLETAVSFYLKCCSIEVNIDDLAHAAATFANFGICPVSQRKVFSYATVRDTLSLMLSSGTYDHSGEFAFKVGLPAKSGISGGMMVVVPEVMGIAIYSPPLDDHGNSVRGIAFCEHLVNAFNLHQFDPKFSSAHGKEDPRR